MLTNSLRTCSDLVVSARHAAGVIGGGLRAADDIHAMHVVHECEQRDLSLVGGVAQVVAVELGGLFLPNHLLQGHLHIRPPLLLPGVCKGNSDNNIQQKTNLKIELSSDFLLGFRLNLAGSEAKKAASSVISSF